VSSEVPVKSGLPLIISANIHPILHMSTGVEYFLDPNNTSGARYLAKNVQVILYSYKKCVEKHSYSKWQIDLEIIHVGRVRETKQTFILHTILIYFMLVHTKYTKIAFKMKGILVNRTHQPVDCDCVCVSVCMCVCVCVYVYVYV
jgi:hypothetical protein